MGELTKIKNIINNMDDDCNIYDAIMNLLNECNEDELCRFMINSTMAFVATCSNKYLDSDVDNMISKVRSELENFGIE